MRSQKTSVQSFLIPALICIMSILSSGNLSGQNLKVFILAGQSNMQGHGEIEPASTNGTLSHFMATDNTNFFDYVQDVDGSWATQDDVWLRYQHEDGHLLADNLTIGFGASDTQIGPELGIGHVLGEYYDEQVLLIKTCWGGKSLAVDFRPPSSGGTVGPYYNQMISDVRAAIDNIATEFPQYTGGQIDIAGFAWFQGWNDGESETYLNEYEQNLINLIADVRSEFEVPDLPFVIGLTGNGGRDIEEGDGWVNGLQTSLVPAQIRAANYTGHTKVAFAETRDFWRVGELSPEPDFLHHWNNNAESYLRIGHEIGIEMINTLNAGNPVNEVIDPEVGGVQNNTNAALPASYNYKEYVFAQPNDQGACQGIINNTATIDQIYLAQTHRRAIGHPLFFTIGFRPAVLQVAVTGSGAAPDVTVIGTRDGSTIGTLCLSGPASLGATIDLSTANFEDYFSVTLPKSWIEDGLELTIEAGNASRLLSPTDLKIGPYTEMNLVEVKMDIIDYNITPVIQNKQADLLEELASAIPASVVRYGTFPEVIPFPEYVVSNDVEQLLRFSSVDEYDAVGFSNLAQLNSVATLFMESLQQACGDYTSTVYFGNTLNLNPGGWGGNRTFVAADYDDVFIHELGHALSLPHWGEEFNRPVENDDEYLYPYGGDVAEPGLPLEGGGIGETWTFIQHEYAFVNPKCVLPGNDNIGLERSDCMQREISCNEWRGNAEGPWEGFSDFSSYAMHHYLVGGAVINGQVPYRNEMIDFQIPKQEGFPMVSLVNGKRVFERDPLQAQDTGVEDWFNLPGEEQINQDIYLLYGFIHPTQDQANVLYQPLKMNGTLLPNIDPTDPQMFATLKNLTPQESPVLYYNERDITLKVYYDDGSIRHVIVPYQSFERESDYYGIWRRDVAHFAVTVPADKNICSVEMYHRPFLIRDANDDSEGNINFAAHNITAANFMSAAVLKAQVDFSCNCPGMAGYVLPGTPCNDGNPDTYNDVEDGSCNCVGMPMNDECNFIRNGRFTSNFASWWTWGSTVTNPDGVATFSDINPDDAGIAQGPFNLAMDESFVIEFDAFATEERTINVFITASAGTFTRYFSESVNLTLNRQSYTLGFDMTADEVVEIEFNFEDVEAGQGASIFLDQVSLRKDDCPLFDPCVENLLVSSPVAPGFHKADIELSSDGQINTEMSLHFQAGQAIELLPTFEIVRGAELMTTITPCLID